MPKAPLVWPVKQRELHNHHMNSAAWNDFKFRDDDVVIATWGKSGTTWMQQIVGQLIYNGAEGIETHKLSPWIDFRLRPPESFADLEAQSHRRFVKTHLPVDALVFSPKAKYIYIGRDGRDAVWSYYNHHANHTDQFFAAINSLPGRVGPQFTPVTQPVDAYFRSWFDGDGYPYWPFWPSICSWWAIRDLPNVLFVHFNDLKADLLASIHRIAIFLDIRVDAANLAAIVDHCSFDYMKSHAENLVPRGGAAWKGGATTFMNQGANGRWRDVLTPSDVAAYEKQAVAELGAECAAWLANGSSLKNAN